MNSKEAILLFRPKLQQHSFFANKDLSIFQSSRLLTVLWYPLEIGFCGRVLSLIYLCSKKSRNFTGSLGREKLVPAGIEAGAYINEEKCF